MRTLPVRPFGIVLLMLLVAAAGCSNPTPTLTPVPIGGSLSDAALGIEPTPTPPDALDVWNHGYEDGRDYACAYASVDNFQELRVWEEETDPEHQARMWDALLSYSAEFQEEYSAGYEAGAWDVAADLSICGL